MKADYCIVPEQDKFLALLAALPLKEEELALVKTVVAERILLAPAVGSCQIEYHATEVLPEALLSSLAVQLAAALSLKKVELVCTQAVQIVPKQTKEQKHVQPVKSTKKQEIAVAPVEAPTASDDAFERAYASVYGSDTARKDGLIYGESVKGRVRPLSEITEEENNIVVEGQYVVSFDQGLKGLVPFNERVLRNEKIKLVFNLSDDEGGIYINMLFDTQAACDAFKKKLSLGMRLRISGNATPDKYSFNEMTLTPKGIMVLPQSERMDNATEKRVELHCHTQMSKLDAVTPMKKLVQTAIKWGHKALAITDHGVVQAFPFCYKEAVGSDLKLILGMEGYLLNTTQQQSADAEREIDDTKQKGSKKSGKIKNHIIILAKNETGLRNLYKLVSLSHLRNFDGGRPLLTHQQIQEYRDGLLIGSACEAGELYRAIRDKQPETEIERIAAFYDYFEIQPTGNNMFLVRENRCTVEDLQNNNRKIYELGKKMGKLTVATCDVHFLEPGDSKYRAVIQGVQNYQDADQQAPLYFRTTEEMLQEFDYFGEAIAYELCVSNPNKIAAMIDNIKPVPDEDQLYTPTIPGAVETIPKMVYERAHAWYGDTLPQLVEDRIKMELNSIIGHGFSVLYYIAHKLVKKSLDDGYLVGSRGSVGSSLVATLIDITEVNPLHPHDRCPTCRYSEFFTNGEYDSGFDLPEKNCPHCGTPMWRDGHNIPFAVFLGFDGDKVPDIDLNFSGLYQPTAHKYTEELFGRDNVCRAGTISTVAIKTAYGYVKKYYELRGRTTVHQAHIAALVQGIAGIKRTTGQHPGGIMVVPRNMDIHYITPMNRPADDKTSTTITTHFDYHSINDRLVKLDILGHDDPTVIKLLEEYTHIQPTKIPIGDEATMSIFSCTDALGVTPAEIGSEVGTYGIPECGTKFVRQMLQDVKPRNFSQLVRVSGYSHGTDVWLNNAEELIKSHQNSDDTISTRDDVMTKLIAWGVKPILAFKTMEHVRKGKAHKSGLTPDMVEAMKEAEVPQWFIDSCLKIQYLFPKAHAVAYVLMAYRIAYCKVHYPREFYAAYFTVRAPDFDDDLVCRGASYMKRFITDVYAQGTKANKKDKDTVVYMELAVEMLSRGLKFAPMDIYKSDPTRFLVTEDGVRPPLAALSGIGQSVAMSIGEARANGVPFISQDDLRMRAKVSKAVVDKLAAHGALGDMPESDQIDLFASAFG